MKIVDGGKDGWLTKLANSKWKKWIFIIGIAAILIIFLSEFIPFGKKTDTTTSHKIDADEYTAALEKRLSEIVSKIDGAGQCKVLVTLQNGVEYVYASQEKVNNQSVEDNASSNSKKQQSADSEQSIIIVETDKGKEGLLVTEIQPTVKGVVVVCEGGDNELIRKRVTDAVTTALNISSTRVCVVK